ncbi:MAG: YqeG family HAD IIIA-type phosphatase [Candidatus Acetothermia bacterium]|nr:YqeG family HAD IIIA-type phosphatase [Candidatus Acetothermia bacterium]
MRFGEILPDRELESIFELEPASLKAAGKRGIIFDLDNTLAPRGARQLDRAALALLDRLREEGLLVGILSNDQGLGREHLQGRTEGCPIYFNARKPRRAVFRQLLREMGLSPEEAVMVGDNLFTDIWGAKRLGLYAILVRPLDPREPSHIRLVRLAARAALSLGRLLGC